MQAEDRHLTQPYSPILRLHAGPQGISTTLSGAPHILLVLDGFPKTLGGGERIVLRLGALLPQYGYRVSILTLALHPESEFRIEDSPCPLYLLPLTKTYDRKAWAGALALRKLIRSEKIAIVQSFFESSDLWAGFFTRMLSPAKVIWSRRDMGILRGAKHAAAYRAMRRLPHSVFAVSEQVRQHAIQVDGIAPERVHTVYNGLDVGAPDLPRERRDPGSPHITTVGNIRRVKGHDLFIRAAGEVLRSYPKARFSIAGEVLEQEYFDELQTLVATLGLSGHFMFLGGIKDLAGHLRTADLFVLPSRSEGFSNSLVEAMAMGLPVIATQVGGNGEAIQHESSGLLIPSENASALAEALDRVLGSEALAEHLGSEAREVVARHFTTSAMMRKMLNVYSELLAQGNVH